MLPENNLDTTGAKAESDKAFAIDFDNKTIDGMIEGREALMQAIRMALMTQRYKYPVFSHDYGTDFEGVFNEGYLKAMGKAKNAIYDSLIYDSRIKSIDDFEFERKGTKMIIRFTVLSVYGSIKYETEVG